MQLQPAAPVAPHIDSARRVIRLATSVESQIAASPAWDMGAAFGSLRHIGYSAVEAGRYLASTPGHAQDGAALIMAARVLEGVSRDMDAALRSRGTMPVTPGTRERFAQLLRSPLEDARRLAALVTA